MSNITRALYNSEWKAATVLAGSVTEALLLWALEKYKDKISILLKEGAIKKPRSKDLNE